MDFNELENYLTQLPDRILKEASEIVAETATEYFKERFTEKSFDGHTWPLGKPKKRGSLLVDSGNLLNSIRPTYIGADKVVISAGNMKVDYAKIHNEGFVGPVIIPAHTRRTRRSGSVPVKAHTRQVNIPKRPFMGKANELADKIHGRLEIYINSLNSDI